MRTFDPVADIGQRFLIPMMRSTQFHTNTIDSLTAASVVKGKDSFLNFGMV